MAKGYVIKPAHPKCVCVCCIKRERFKSKCTFRGSPVHKDATQFGGLTPVFSK